MKKEIILLLFCSLLIVSCGTELPDNIKNYEVKKDEGKNDENQNPSETTTLTIPSESDNPLPNLIK